MLSPLIIAVYYGAKLQTYPGTGGFNKVPFLFDIIIFILILKLFEAVPVRLRFLHDEDILYNK